MSQSILECKNLSKIFVSNRREKKVLNNISFKLNKAEILGVIGESGCGKSTLARIILGLCPATSGEVTFSNCNILDLKPKDYKAIYKDIQMIFQNPVQSFNPRQPIGEAIKSAAKNLCHMDTNESEEALREVLSDVGLSMEYIKKYPHEMSGGQCQRAAIARALIVNPQILICDEATSALDVIIQSKIITLLEELRKKKNISIIFITHDLPLVCTFSDRIIIMENGIVVESGKTKDILHNSKSEYTRKLLESVIRL